MNRLLFICLLSLAITIASASLKPYKTYWEGNLINNFTLNETHSETQALHTYIVQFKKKETWKIAEIGDF